MSKCPEMKMNLTVLKDSKKRVWLNSNDLGESDMTKDVPRVHVRVL
jgi:hypothetical protein